jgi:hypothetical protein
VTVLGFVSVPVRSATIFGAFLLAAACSKAGDEAKAKRSPLSPPPSEVKIPAELNIPVEIDGEEAEPVTAARLSALAPDFADHDRRAWRLTRVLGDAFAAPGSAVEAVGKTGVGISMARPEGDGGPQPVLYLTRRGEVVAAVVEPDDPFPDYHGLGGRLRRPGDPLPRVLPVVSLRVRTDRKDAAGGGPNAPVAAGYGLDRLVVSLDGGAVRPLSPGERERLPEVVLEHDDDEPRASWSLRHLAGVVGGPGASVTRVVAGDGGEVSLLGSRWDDDALKPILRANRRGELVFQWIDTRGEPDGEILRGISRVDVVR